ncbi:MAG: hypothetical protein VYA34_07355 [Myxococcota bacterium]|nr:hypothetical protein [Myxococcota bacterium]
MQTRLRIAEADAQAIVNEARATKKTSRNTMDGTAGGIESVVAPLSW